MNEKYKYLGKNTLLFTISSFGTKLLSFFLVPLYTNVLSTAEYGIADLITTTATLLVFVLTLDIADGVLRYVLDVQNGFSRESIVQGGVIARTRSGEVSSQSGTDGWVDQQAILSYGNRVTAIGTLVCLLGVGVVYYLGVIDWPWYYFLFIALYFFASAIYQLMSSYLRAVDKVGSVAVAGIVSSLVTITCNILFLLIFQFGITGYLGSMVLGPLVATIYSISVAGAPARTYFINSCSKAMQREMRKYCTPLIFNNIALWMNAFLDRYFVTAMCGVNANGIYSVASKIPVILATCYTVFGQAWNLSAIKEFDPEDRDGFFSNTYCSINALLCTVCSLIVLFNVPLARILYAKDFFEAWRYSSVLLVYVLFDSFAMLLAGVFSAVKQTKIIATTTVISAVVNTVLNFLLIPVIGPLGAAISTGVSYFVIWAIRVVYAKRYIKLKLHLQVDFVAYALIILQIVFEHLSGHVYPGQLVCFIATIVLYRKQLKGMVGPIKFLLASLKKQK